MVKILHEFAAVFLEKNLDLIDGTLRCCKLHVPPALFFAELSDNIGIKSLSVGNHNKSNEFFLVHSSFLAVSLEAAWEALNDTGVVVLALAMVGAQGLDGVFLEGMFLVSAVPSVLNFLGREKRIACVCSGRLRKSYDTFSSSSLSQSWFSCNTCLGDLHGWF